MLDALTVFAKRAERLKGIFQRSTSAKFSATKDLSLCQTAL